MKTHRTRDFEGGLSEHCATFASPQLTKKSAFAIIDVELYGVN